jgi:hypothetical protein
MDGGCYNARSLARCASIVEVREIYIFKYEYHETIEISRTCVIKTVEEDERGRQMARYVETPVDDDIDTDASYEDVL